MKLCFCIPATHACHVVHDLLGSYFLSNLLCSVMNHMMARSLYVNILMSREEPTTSL